MAETRPDLLLADLHLPAANQEASLFNEAFLRFCAGPARQARRVFILGDLFESWVGDDLGLAAYPREVDALRQLTASGTTVHYQTGNRDFLLGPAFARATGTIALPDEHVTELGGQLTLLAHGDQFCTDDIGYQRWRRFSHQGWAQWLFLKLPASRRQAIAGELRGGSNRAKRNKPEAIMDVNASAIAKAMTRHGVKQLIHGHTHRPAEHELLLAGQAARRIVLADWRSDRMEWLEVGPSEQRRREI